MVVYAPTNDFQYIKSQNPYAEIQLYQPGTKLSATDVALGGTKSQGGILDEHLGGAQRYYGNDKVGTANEYNRYLSELTKQQPQMKIQSQTQSQTQSKSKTPTSINDIIGADPEARAIYDQVKQQAQLGSRNAMETLNTRGILNSSITGDTVTGLEQQAMTNVLPQLYALHAQRQQQNKVDAYNKMNMLGYADNEVAKILGIPVGTKSSSLSMQEAGLTGMYKGQKTLAAQQADQAAYEFERQYGLSVGEALGSINGNPTLAAIAQQIQDAQFKASQTQNQSQFEQSLAADQSNQEANRAASLAKSNASGPSIAEQKYAAEQDSISATADAFDVLNDLANQGKTRDEILAYIKNHYSEFANGNADMDTLWKLADQAFQWNG